MKLRIAYLSLVVSALLCCPLVSAFEAGITVGPEHLLANQISADGSTVVGQVSGVNSIDAFRWTLETRVSTLTRLPGGFISRAFGVTADGQIVVGMVESVAGQNIAAYWSGANVTRLPSNGLAAGANGVSADGTTIVGAVSKSPQSGAVIWRPSEDSAAVMWKSQGGSFGAPVLLEQVSQGGSYATAASANGTTIVGNYGNSAVTWTVDGGRVTRLFLNSGSEQSWANGVSGDGRVVVGKVGSDLYHQAVRWSGDTMSRLGFLPGDQRSVALGISLNGKVIVGNSDLGVHHFRPGGAFRWTQETGMQRVEDWLRANGASVNGQITEIARSTNADGSVVVGETQNARAFIARVVPAPGLLELSPELAASLTSTGRVTLSLLSGSGMILHGVHSLPLSYRVGEGQSTVWGAGDWGWYNQSTTDGTVGLAEIGGGYNFGPVQVNGSIGYSQNREDLSQNGKFEAGAIYLYGEALIPIIGGLWGVIGGYYEWGDVDVSRGYQNARNQAFSSGSPGTESWAVRARLEWDGLVDLSSLRLNPYGEISYAQAKMNSYAETTGAFPVAFNSRTDAATELRIGINGALPISIGNKTRLLALVEGVHRFEDGASAVAGEVLGQGGFTFKLDGASYDQNWLRAGVGVESSIGEGKAFLMLNGATQGETPTVWLAARYQLAF